LRENFDLEFIPMNRRCSSCEERRRRRNWENESGLHSLSRSSGEITNKYHDTWNENERNLWENKNYLLRLFFMLCLVYCTFGDLWERRNEFLIEAVSIHRMTSDSKFSIFSSREREWLKTNGLIGILSGLLCSSSTFTSSQSRKHR
jgi:hypothetical protein